MMIENSPPTPQGLLAIIGGTGVESLPDVSHAREQIIVTRWGRARVSLARHAERDIVFLHRHANSDGDHLARVPPHRINYRANIAALKTLGVTAIFASTAVGSLRPDWQPGTLVLLDQFIDFTSQREKTFFDTHPVHVDVTQPYCPNLRTLLQSTADDLKIELQPRGTYFCCNGPRFETPAEIRAFASWGGDVVGMTGVPEVVLAREAQIAYAGVSIVTNLAAGISAAPLTQAEVLDAMRVALPRVVQLFLTASRDYTDDATWDSRRATEEFRTPHFDPQREILESTD